MMLSLLQLKLFAICYPLFICIDILWIGFIMRNIYIKQLGHILHISNGAMVVNWPVAFCVWALVVFGAIIFVLPHIQTASWMETVCWGGVYGLILYGVYDLTNYAMLANWPLSITLIDIVWGVIVNTLLATAMRISYQFVQ